MDLNNFDLEQLIVNGDKTFGPHDWSHEIKKQIIDFVDQIDGIYVVGCTTIVKIFLRDGRIHEEMAFKESRSDSYGIAYDQARNGSFIRALYDTFLFFKEFRDNLSSLTEQKLKRLANQERLKFEWRKKNNS
ncbi:DNA repair and recombination protein RAD52-like [Cotesia glomerata]|uniref:DNA repair and recombination protein RAD52-like n=1 Tax=Cotesia glomerata TaxID=32391 RepID=UPI001D01AE6A|nr:DNA repair and recombination protein RAD52-like [Cotesia glomerata]